MSIPCEWFALCDRPATGDSEVPRIDGTLVYVPICDRCAERSGMPRPTWHTMKRASEARAVQS